MNLLAVVTLLLALAFSDIQTCTVQGYVYNMDAEGPTFSRVDACAGIRHRVESGQLLLYSQHYWVLIVLPVTRGQERLEYPWRGDHALFRTEAWPIAFGRVARG